MCWGKPGAWSSCSFPHRWCFRRYDHLCSSLVGGSTALSPSFHPWCSGQSLARISHLLPSASPFASCLPHICVAEVFLVIPQGQTPRQKVLVVHQAALGKYGEEGCEHQKPLLAQLYFLMAVVGFFCHLQTLLCCACWGEQIVFFYWRKRKLLYKLKFSKGKFQVGYWKIWWGQSKRSTVFWVALGSHQCTELHLPTFSKPQVKALVWKLHGVPL